MGVDDDVDEVLDPNYNPYLGDSDDDDFCWIVMYVELWTNART